MLVWRRPVPGVALAGDEPLMARYAMSARHVTGVMRMRRVAAG
jgi:hypothetical protein